MEKYFEAQTTVAEEEVLRSYFAQEEVAAHLEVYRPMVRLFFPRKNRTVYKRTAFAQDP